MRSECPRVFNALVWVHTLSGGQGGGLGPLD